MKERVGPKNLTEYRSLYRPDMIDREVRDTAVRDVASSGRKYRLHGCLIWLDIDENVCVDFKPEDIEEFVMYRLNFKHGTDGDVEVREVVVWPEDDVLTKEDF